MEGLADDLKRIPWWGWVVAVLVIVAFLAIRARSKRAAAGSTGVQPQDVSAMAGAPTASDFQVAASFQSMGELLQGIQQSDAALQKQNATISSQLGAISTAVSQRGPQPNYPDPHGLATTLPRVNADLFPRIALPNTQMSVIGTHTSTGYQGLNVSGGVPVYAFIGGHWMQGFNSSTLPVGTPIAIPSGFQSYESYVQH